MPRKSIYDIAALAVVIWLAVMMLGIGGRMLSADAQQSSETDDVPTEASDPRLELMKMTRAERDPLRDRDGVVWGMLIDWAALYPRKEEPAAEQTVFDRLAGWVDDAKAVTAPYELLVGEAKQFIDDYATDYAPDYQEMVEFANRYDTFIGWDIVDMGSYNPVVMAEENYFITCVSPQDRTERAEEIVALRDYCAERGIRHLYVTTPNNACRNDTRIANVIDFYNQNADRLQKALRDAGVETIDLRDELHAAGMDHHSCFFQTDHHWLPQTGRWAAGVIARRLNEDYGFDIDLSVFEPERWRTDTYHDWFLGSQGKKVTLARATPEDFQLFYPKFPAKFLIDIPSLDVYKSGGFSVFYRYNALRTLDYYKENPYASYLFGDRALTRVHNLTQHNGKRVLILGHSFDNCVIPFLSLGVERVDSIDLREFTGSVETFLDENQYDVVIELYTE